MSLRLLNIWDISPGIGEMIAFISLSTAGVKLKISFARISLSLAFETDDSSVFLATKEKNSGARAEIGYWCSRTVPKSELFH